MIMREVTMWHVKFKSPWGYYVEADDSVIAAKRAVEIVKHLGLGFNDRHLQLGNITSITKVEHQCWIADKAVRR